MTPPTIPEQDLRRMMEVSSSPENSSGRGEQGTQDERAIARLRLLWDRRRVLARATLGGLLLATVIAFITPKRYQSTTQLMPPDDQTGSGMAMAAALAGRMSGALSGLAGDALGLKSSGDLFIGILNSRTVQDDVVNKFDLRKVYGTSRADLARRRLAENTAISQDRKSGIITIAVTDHSAQRAAAIAGEYVAELNTVASQLSTSSAHRERVFLEGRLAQVKEDLESAEKDFSEFASKNAAIDIKEQGRAMVESAATVEGQLIAAQSELQGVKQIYSENNVRVRSLRARISELQSQLQRLGGKQEIAADAANSDTGDLYPSIRKLPLLGVPYADLYRRTRVQEAVFESLTQEYELAKVAEAKELPSVKVLDVADVPEYKSFPPRLAIIVLGALCGLCVGVGYLVGKARWEEAAPDSPYKVVIGEIVASLRPTASWEPAHGSRLSKLFSVRARTKRGVQSE